MTLGNWLRARTAKLGDLITSLEIGDVLRAGKSNLAAESARTQPRRPLDLAQLEDRVMLSASPVGLIADAAGLEALPEGDIGLHNATDIQPAVPDDVASSTALQHENDAGTREQALIRELVFVDTAAPDYQQLVDDLLANSNAGRIFEVILLDAERDGIEQIGEALQGYQDLNAVHVVSHGTSGEIKLGNTWLSLDNVGAYAGQLVGWRDALASGADLLIYGCDLAATDDGQLLVESLGTLTSADVAASEDNTGHAALGGDWDLEYTTGAIESEVAFSQDLQQNWGHLLNVAVDATSTGTTTGASATISHTTSSDGDRLMLVGVTLSPNSGETVSSITYNGSSLSLVGAQNGPAGARVEIWSLVAPDAGTHDVVVNLSAGTHGGATVGVMTFTGVDQTTALGTFASGSGDATSGSVAVSSAADELVFGVVAVKDADQNLVPGAGQTEQWDLFTGSEANGGGSTEAGAASVDMSWTWTAGTDWAIGGVSIKQAAGTPTSFQQGTASYTGTQDTELDSGSPDTVQGANASITIDLDDGSGATEGLIRFEDIFGSGPGQIAPGSTIYSASLQVFVTNPATGGDVIGLHRMLTNWDENSTWNTLTGGIVADGLEAAVSADSTLATPGSSGLVTFSGLESALQAWSDGGTNYGWAVLTDSTDGWDFDSSEAATVSQRPQLIINYTVSDAPVITLPGAAVNYTENDPATIIDATATASDPDSTDFDNGTLTIDFAANGTANDRLAIRNEGTGSGQIGVSGSNVTYNFGAGAVTIGSYAGGTDGSTPLVITFNASSTPTAAQALMRNITYENVSDDPSISARSVRFVLNDGDAGTSTAVLQTVNITAVNDPPTAVDNSYSVNEDETLDVSPTTTNLVDWWKLDDGGTSQTAVDSVAPANNGTLGSTVGADASDPTWVAGHVGSNALSFDGTDDYVETTSTFLQTANEFTLSTWFQTDTTTGPHHLLWQGYSGGNGYGDGGVPADSELNLSINSFNQDNKIVFFLGYDIPGTGADPIYIVSASDFTDTTDWHHVAVTVTDLGGGVFSGSMYVDGVLEGTDTGDENDRTAWASPLLIGKPGAATRYFDGQIDDVRIYDAALSTSDVKDIALAGVLQNDTDPENNILDAILVSGPANGTLSLNADGSFSYTPDADYNGVDTFTYKNNDGAVDSNVATATITVNAVNDAAVLDLDADDSRQPGSAYLATFAGSPALIADADASLSDIDSSNLSSLTVTITNLLDGASEVLAADTSGTSIGASYAGGVLSLTGSDTLANYQQVLRTVTYDNTSTAPDSTARLIQFVANDGTDNSLAAITTVNFGAALWLSTSGDVLSPSGAPGLDSWSDSEALEFGGSGLTLESGTTSGNFSSQFDIDNFTTGANVTAMHYVTRALTLGTTDTFDVQGGDLLLSVESNTTLTGTNTLAVESRDIFLFRPNKPGVYTQGAFYMLLDDPLGASNLSGVSLVEADTTVGGVTLLAGEFLLAEDNLKNVFRYTADEVGPGTTSGVTSTLIDGSDINFSSNLFGVELIEESITVGDVTLSAGQVLVTLASDDASVGDNAIAAASEDIFFLDVTTAGTSTVANATLLFEGADVGLNSNEEGLDSIALVTNLAPLAEADAYNVFAQTPLVVDAADGVLSNDGDPNGNAVSLTLVSDVSNGMLTLNNDGSFSYTPDPGFVGTDSFTYRVNDGVFDSATATVTLVVRTPATANSLVLATAGDVGSPSGAPGLDSWSAGSVLDFSDPSLALEPGVTSGTFALLTNIDTLAADGNTVVNAIHRVSRDITIGGDLAPAIDLFTGDLLLVMKDGETLNSTNSLAVTKEDLFVFRPDTPGDYSAGTFTMLLEDVSGTGAEIRGISLVEQDTAVGDTLVQAGTFLFSTGGGGTENLVQMFVVDDVGAGTTSGTRSIFIDGDDVGITAKILAVELLEQRTTIGDTTLDAGYILISVENSANVGDNNLSVTRQDVFYLDVTSPTVASATLLLEGLDVGLDTNNESITGLSLVIQSAPVISLPGGAVNYTENDPVTVIDATATAIDTDSNNFDTGTLTIDFAVNGTANDRLSIRNEGTGAGQIGVSGSNVTYNFGAGAVTIGTFAGGTDGSTPLVITFNASSTPAAAQALMRNITYENVSDDPDETARTVRFTLADGDGGTSDAATKTINVTATNDPPIITSDGGGATAAINVAENSTAATTVTATDGDGDIPVYSISGGADAARFTINSSTGVLTFVSAPDYETPTDVGADNVYDVIVQASDGTLTDTQAIAVTVTTVNDNTPEITSGGGGSTAAVNVAENATAVTTVTATDADLPAETLTFSITGGVDAAKFAINSSSGVLTFVAAPDYEAPTDAGADNVYDVTVQVSDGTLTDSQAIAVTVTPVTDNTPVITSDGGGATAAVNVAENATAVTTVTATDADLPAETLTYSITGGADAAKFAINSSSGALTFVAAPDYESPTDTGTDNVYDVTVQVSDGTLIDSQTIAVTVTPQTDNAPVITSDGGGSTAGINVAENATAVTTVTATDADLPAETLTYSITGGVDAAKFAINGSSGVLTFVAAPDYEAPTDAGADNVYDVTVQVSDGTLTDSQAIAVTVTPLTDNTPVITSDGGGATAAVNVAENATAVTTVTATDADLPAETLTYSITGGADAGKFAINSSSGVLTFVAAPDYETPTDVGANNVYDVTVQVSDGTLTDSQTIAVTVTPQTDNTPVITSDGGGSTAGVNVAENATAVTTVTATDADLPAETLTYSIIGGVDAARFAINSSSGVLTFVAAPNYESPTDAGADNVYDVTVQASDGTLTDSQAIAVTVTPVTDNTPVITSDGGGATAAVNVAENSTAVTTVTATDADLPAETLTYTITGGADSAKFAINSSSGALTFVAAPDYETPTDIGTDNVYDVTVQVSDGTLTDSQTIAVTVTPVTDNAPVITSDGGGATAAVNVAENATAVTTVTATDADLPAETLTYSITGGADSAKFAINSSSGALTFVAAPDYETPTDVGTDNVYDVTVQVSDGTQSDTQAIAVTVTPQTDNTPVITSDGGGATAAVNVAENSTAVTTVTATDADLPAETLTYTITGGADSAKFAINSSSGALTFVAAPDYETPTDIGTDNVYDVTVQVSDGTLTDTQAIAVTVTASSDNAPVITSNGGGSTAGVNVAENGTAVTTVTATDADLPAETLTYSIIGGSDSAKFAINSSSGVLTFVSAPDYETPTDAGADNVYDVTVQVSDGAQTDTQAIAVTVTPQTDNTPVITSDGGGATAAVNVAENSTAVTTVTATDADLPAETLTYTISGGADSAKFAINSSSGALTFVAAPDYETPTDIGTDNVYDVTVQVSDGTLTDTQAIAVTVTASSDNAPVITSNGGGSTAGVNVAENGTAVTTVTATDADLPAETLTYSIIGGSDSAKFAINSSSGVLTFVSAPDYETPTDAGADNVYDVTVQVSDGTLTDTQAIAVTVTPVTDNAPVITSDGGGATAAVNVAENSTAVTTVTATDADLPAETLTYTITGGADSAKFAINSSSGALTFVAAPDYETPTDIGTDNVYDVTVQVSDGTLTDTQAIAVTVTASSDNAPVITSNGGGSTAGVNVTENGTAVTTVTATDADLPSETLTYSITGGSDSAKFAINSSSGVLTFVSAPDYETPTDAGADNVYDVTVQVSDGTLTDTQAIAVTVTPVTDNTPVITSDGAGATAALNVAENSTAVTTVTATDADLPSETLTYSISGGVDAAKFAINSSSGILTFVAAPDYETPTDTGTNNVYDVTVQVSDGTLTDTQAIAVTVTPVTDNTPVITSDGGGATAAVNVAENATAVTTVTATDADLPSETLTYSITGGADAAKFAINSSSGVLTFVAAPDYETPTDTGTDNIYDVTVQVSDGTLTDTQAIAVTVTPVTDNTPVITSDGAGATAALNVAENATAVTTVTATDADLPSETLTYSISGGVDAAKFAINSSSGVLTFVAAPDYETPTDTGTDNVYDVTVQVSDGTLTDTQAIAVTVTPVTDNTPVITSDGAGATAALNVAENSTAVTTVTATDADLPSETLTYSISGGVDAAKFAINSSSGILTFVAAPDYETPTDTGTNNVYDVTVQVSDGTLTDTQAIAVTVTPVTDNTPVITSDGGGATAAVNVAENSTAVTTVTATDADLPSETLTYSITGGVDAAKFAINSSSGILTFVATPDYETPTDTGTNNVYDVTVQVSDGTLTDTQAIAVTVTPVTDNTPVITSDGGGATAAVNVAENATAVTTVTATDADLPSETLTYSISGGADSAKFAINSSSGVLTFVAAPDYETPTDTGTDNVYDVTVQVSDGTLTDTQAIAVTVTPVTDNTPVITSDGGGATAAVNVAENATAVTTVTATDADLPSETLTYSITGGADAAKFAINSSSGVLTFVAAPDYETPTDTGTDNVYDVTVQVSDGTLTDTQAIAVTVTPVTDNTPVITSDGGGATAAVNVAENATVVTTVTATDADLPSETLTYSITGGVDAAKFAINSSSGVLTFVAAPDYETPTDTGTDNVYDVTVQVSDGTLTDTQAIAVSVTPVTDNTPVITSDGGGATAAVNVAENATAVTTVAATDADLPSETLTYSITGGVDAAKFAINSSSGVLTFVAAPDYETPTDTGTDNVYDVTVQVSDGTLTDTQAIAVTVTPVTDNTPVITSDGGGATAAINVAENATAVTTVTATDADLPSETLTYSITGGVDAAKFAINSSSGALTFIAAPDYETPTDTGTDNVYDVTVQVSDGTLTDTQAIAVTVTQVTDNTPVITSDGGGATAAVNVAENSTAVTTVTATDADLPSETLTYSITGGVDAAKFAINSSSGILTFVAAPDYETPTDTGTNNVYDVTVQVSDGTLTDTQAIAVTVTPVTDNTPVITSDGGGATAAVNVAENSTAVTTVTATDADLPSETLTYSISGGADSAKFAINSSSGVLTFVAAPDYETPTDTGTDNVYDVTVQVSDGTLTDTQAIAVTVTPVTDNTPVITSDGGGATAAVNVAENSTAVTTVTATDADLPSETLTYSISGGADSAKFAINSSSGALTFVAAPDYETPTDTGTDNVYDVTVQVSDGTLTDTQAIAVTVTQVTDNTPVITSDGGGATAAVNVAENSTAVTTVTATDADLPSETLTYSISGGADSAKFAINSSSGVLTFVAAPDYETPTDTGTDNVYDVTVQVSDGTLTDTQAIAVTVTPVTDNTPVITSDGGGATAAVNVAENSTAVTTVTATDADLPSETLTYSISGGADSAKFAINSSSGALTFVAAPDYETPTDVGTDNIYDVTVQVSDGTLTDTQAIAVTVTQVTDNTPVITSDGGGATAAVNVAENSTEVTTVTATDADLPAETLTYSISGGADAAKFAINSSSGALTFVAAPDYETPTDTGTDNVYDVTVQVSDGTLTDTQAIAVTVTQVTDNTPVITSDGGGATAAVNVAENSTAVTTVTATDADLPSETLTYSISGGADSAKFAINSSSGVLTFVAAPDYETPTDTGTDNVYDVTVQVSDGTLTDTQAIAVTVTPVTDNTPVITSDGGGATAAVNVAENSTAVTTVTATDADLPSETLTYSISGGADSAKFAINSSSGVLTFVAAPDYETPTDTGTDNVYDVTVQVSDGTLTDTQAIAVTVTPVTDNTPVITSDGGGASAAVNVAENATAVTTVTATDADLPTETLTYSISGGADSAKFAINSSSGVLTFVAAPDYETPTDTGTDNVYDVTVQVSDGTLTDTQAIAVTVTPVTDNTPVITSDGGGATAAVNVAENSTAVTTVTATDADLPSETLTYSISGGADSAKFAINSSSGVLTFVAAPDYETPTDTGTDNVYDVTVQVSDGTLTDTQAIAVTVTPVTDNTPVITSDGGGATAAVNVAENSTAVTTVTATDADLPTETLTYSISGGADSAKFAINSSSGVLTFVAAPDYETPTDTGTDNVYDVTVQVSDGTLTDTQAIAVTVTPVTDNTPVITSDGGGATAAVNVAENSTAVTTVTATDADLPSETLTYSISGGADSAKFAINSSSGALTFVAAPDYETPTDTGTDNVYDVTVQVSDGTLTDTQAIAVTVTQVTDNTPVITSDGGGATAAVNVAENSTAVTTVTATDADLPAETLTYSISGGADSAKFAINSSSGALTFVAAPDYETPTDTGTDNVYDVTVQVSDGTLTDTQAIAVTVTPVTDNTPVITSDGGGATAAVNVAENPTAVTTVTATDADLPAETLTYSISGGADSAKFAINSSSGVLTFVAAPDYETPTDTGTDNVYDVTVQVSDGTLTDTQAIAVTVTPVTDNTPVITSDGGGASAAVNVAENATAVTTVTATDADLPSETLTYSISGGADSAKFAINSSSGVLTFVAAPDYETPTDTGTDNVYDVTVQVSDGTLSDFQVIAVAITPINDNMPVVTSDGGGAIATVNVIENGTTVTTVTATDADLPGQTLTYSLSGGMDQGLFTIDTLTGALTFIDAPDFESPLDANADNVYEVQVTIDDGAGGTSSQSIRASVTDANETPQVNADAFDVDEDTTLSVAPTVGVLSNDIDPEAQTLTATLVTGPVSGTLVLRDDGSFTYTPDLNFNGSDTFTYRATDGFNVSTVATVAITVNSVNDNPVGNSESYTVNNDATLIVTAAGVLANDNDVEGDTLSATLVTGPTSGTLVLATDGSFVFTPTLSFSGIVTFSYQASDGAGSSNVVTVTIDVIAAAAPAGSTAPPAEPAETNTETTPPSESTSSAEIDAPATNAPTVAAEPNPRQDATDGSQAEAAPATPAEPETESNSLVRATDNSADEESDAARNRSRATRKATDISRIELVQASVTANPYFDTRVFWERLNTFEQEITSNSSSIAGLTAGHAAGVTLAFTAGYVVWTIKGGYLMASFLSSLPAWQSMDPLPILAGNSDYAPPKRWNGKIRGEVKPDDEPLF